ncbi:hypothetical protein GYH30_049525 [Glycine max]|nr:hypothetical protein GYH30_049525 [Glycine max]
MAPGSPPSPPASSPAPPRDLAAPPSTDAVASFGWNHVQQNREKERNTELTALAMKFKRMEANKLVRYIPGAGSSGETGEEKRGS